ncbi:MAG: preprotein translocase subunit SecE [Dehalococcoidia bacterium]|nr:preprotein translocase subunit SecE [Dehalococcoidia bacterium]
MTTERKSLSAGTSAHTAKKGGVIGFIAETVGEFKKVVWPSRKDVIRLTLIVIVVTASLGIILGSIDYGFKSLISFLGGTGG